MNPGEMNCRVCVMKSAAIVDGEGYIRVAVTDYDLKVANAAFLSKPEV